MVKRLYVQCTFCGFPVEVQTITKKGSEHWGKPKFYCIRCKGTGVYFGPMGEEEMKRFYDLWKDYSETVEKALASMPESLLRPMAKRVDAKKVLGEFEEEKRKEALIGSE